MKKNIRKHTSRAIRTVLCSKYFYITGMVVGIIVSLILHIFFLHTYHLHAEEIERAHIQMNHIQNEITALEEGAVQKSLVRETVSHIIVVQGETVSLSR